MDTELIIWTGGLLDDRALDLAENIDDAVFLLEKNKKEFVWNIIRGFERVPVTLPQTSAILDGYSVDGLSLTDLLKVRRFGEGVDFLCRIVKSGDFSVRKNIACSLHGIVSKDEVPDEQRGCFRTRNVSLAHTKFSPPHPFSLDNLWRQDMFSNIENPLERGIAVFAYIARTQFFFDANKRTAMLLLNGILASSAIKPFFVPDSEKGKFSMVLTEFYESGNADNFMNFMADVACPDHEDNEQPAPC